MINDERRQAEKPNRSYLDDLMLNLETGKNPMSNTTTKTRPKAIRQTKESRDEAILLVQRTEALLKAGPRTAARLMRHHTKCALTQLYHAIELVDPPDAGGLTHHEIQHMMKFLQELPKYMRSRLYPVFSRPNLFDPKGEYQLGFAKWEREIIFELERTANWVKKDIVARHCEDFTGTVRDLFCTLDYVICQMRDELEPKYGAALH